MPNHVARERPYRPHARMREEPRPDTITAVLTVQVMICALLLVCAFGMKKLDAVKYAEIKGQYAAMLNDQNQTDKAVEWFSDPEGVFGGVFGALKRYISDIFPEKPKQTETIDPEAEPEYEPLDGQEQKTQMDFDYLGGKDLVYMAARGGLLPIGKSGGGMLPPPSGSTLSPVYAGAKIKPPVTGAVTSSFAYRYHPLTGGSDFHTGIDIASVNGRDILAVLPGKVAEVGVSETYGNYIILQHAENLKTSYSHCSEIIAREGMSVRQGERIALVGETGAATGPHLHFSVMVDGKFTDPVWILKDHIRPVE